MKKSYLSLSALALLSISPVLADVNIQNGTSSVNVTDRGVSVSSSGSSVNISNSVFLEGKISASYKVSLNWKPYQPAEGENLLGYKIVLSYSDKDVAGDGDKIISVGADKSSVEDWNAKKGMNYYKLYVVTSNGSYPSNVVAIGMDGNGGYDFSLKAENKDLRKDLQQNKENIKDNKQQFHNENGYFIEYLSANIGSGDLSVLKQKMKDTEDAARKLLDSSLSGNKQEAVSGVIALYKDFYNYVLQYVDESKTDAYNKFVENKLKMVSENINMRRDNMQDRKTVQDNRKEMKGDMKKSLNGSGDKQEPGRDRKEPGKENQQGMDKERPVPLSKSVMDAINKSLDKALESFFAKVDALSDDQQKELLDKVVAKIDEKIEELKSSDTNPSSRTFAILKLLKDRMMDKISDIGGESTDSTINDILNTVN